MDANEMTKIAEEQRRMAEQNVPAAMERDRKTQDAQIASADELRKLREDLARIERKQDENQKAQAEENQENHRLAIRSLRAAIAAAVFGGGSLVVAIIALAAQLSR